MRNGAVDFTHACAETAHAARISLPGEESAAALQSDAHRHVLTQPCPGVEVGGLADQMVQGIGRLQDELIVEQTVHAFCAAD